MKILEEYCSFQQALQQLFNTGKHPQEIQKNRASLIFPNKLGNGFIETQYIREGIILTIQSFDLKKPMTFTYASTPHVDLHFCLSGNSRIISYHDGKDLSISPNQRCVYNSNTPLNNSRTAFKYHTGQKHIAMTITFTIECLKSFINGLKGPCSQDLGFSMERLDSSGARKGLITPEMATIMHQVMNSKLSGPSKDIFLESKVLELIALHISSSEIENSKRQIPPALKECDIDKIYEAKDILLSDIQNPPTLLNLARQVSLNDYKLKIGFRYVFDNSVYRYLKVFRLETAKSLMANNKYSVLEVANQVGYSNPSHFATSFKKRFGVNPKAYLAGQ